MRKRILDFIICPDCKKDFKLEIFFEDAGIIKEGLLSCSSCGEIYPIYNFIPRIIKGIRSECRDFFEKHNLPINKNENSGKELDILEVLNQKTKKSFSYQWTRKLFSRIIPRFEDDFLNYLYPIQRDFFQGKIGVDIGCGFGRHIYYAAKFGAEMVGVDFSSAIDSAYNNTKELSGVHLIQADIYNLPLKDNCFDLVYSIGVLHHLSNPERGFRTILPLVKSKGHISIWMYSKSRPIVNFIIESIRALTRRIPHIILYLICIILTSFEWLFIIIPYRFLFKIPPLRGFLNKIIFKRIRIYAEYPFDVLSADWFDRLAAPIRYYYSENELEDWFKRANLKLIKISPTDGYGWRALGEKP